MKYVKIRLLILVPFLFILTSCSKDDDSPQSDSTEEQNSGDNENPPTEEVQEVALNNEINEFVWSALNEWYIWQDEVVNLSDTRFTDNNEFNTFLNATETPEALFESLLSPKDRFSGIVQDYNNLFNSFAGISTTNGIEFVLTRPPEGGNAVVGVVRYVVNGSDGEAKGVQRGDIFYAIDGVPLFAQTDSNGFITSSNLDLLNPTTYTMNFANIENNTTVPNGIDIELTKTELVENPVHIVKTIENNGNTIGYLMYNGFTSDFDDELNAAFSQLQSENITDLVLDLRYNPGGSVQSAIRLSSMITGQFAGQLFARQKWNSKWDSLLGFERTFESTIGNTPINSLNLNRVYIIATDDSASASELVINSLEPYIDVVHIGDVTVGKNEFSVTLVDNDIQETPLTNGEFIAFPYIFLGEETLEDADTDHRYALQPLTGTNENANGFGEFTNGLQPDVQALESLGNLGILGEPDEPLLATAIAEINGTSAKLSTNRVPKELEIHTISSSTRLQPNKGGTILDTFDRK